MTKEINALGDSTLYVYDGNGNLVSKTDADGYVTEYSYTAIGVVQLHRPVGIVIGIGISALVRVDHTGQIVDRIVEI